VITPATSTLVIRALRKPGLPGQCCQKRLSETEDSDKIHNLNLPKAQDSIENHYFTWKNFNLNEKDSQYIPTPRWH
jgi:hypothetical protein